MPTELPTFRRVVLVARSPEAAAAWEQHARICGWPYGAPRILLRLADATAAPPREWTGDKPAWTRLQAHARVLEDALADGAEPLLVAEDELRFEGEATARIRVALAAAGPGWQIVDLAGAGPSQPLCYGVRGRALVRLVQLLREHRPGVGVPERLRLVRGGRRVARKDPTP